MSFDKDPLVQGYRIGETIAAVVTGILGGIWKVLAHIFGFGRFPRLKSGPSRTKEWKETKALYQEVSKLFASSPVGNGNRMDIAANIALDARERAGLDPDGPFLEPICDVIVGLMAEEGLWALEEEIPSVVEVPAPLQDIQPPVMREGPTPRTIAQPQPLSRKAQKETTSEKEALPLSTAPAPLPPTPSPPELMPAPIPEIQPQTVTVQTPPKPKKPKLLHTEPAPLGRGGPEHQYLQGLVKQAGEAQGFRAVIEKDILNGQGKVDVSLERDDEKIACEISVTSTPEQELENVRKCLKADYLKVVVLAPNAKRRIRSVHNGQRIDENADPKNSTRLQGESQVFRG